MSMRKRVVKEIARMADLPVVSRILVEMNQVVANANAGAEDLGKVIMGDQALSVRLLRVVNSSYYRGGSKQSVTTVSRAVVMLGFDAVRRLALVHGLTSSGLRGRSLSPSLRESGPRVGSR